MPDFEIEDSLNCMVAGVDEAGRGHGPDRWWPEP